MFTIAFNIFDIFKHYIQKPDSDILFIVDKYGRKLVNIIYTELNIFISDLQNAVYRSIEYVCILTEIMTNIVYCDDEQCLS